VRGFRYRATALLAVLPLTVLGCAADRSPSEGVASPAGRSAPPAQVVATSVPPVGIDGACRVLTAAQVSTALGVQVKVTDDGPLPSTVPERACSYRGKDDTVLVMFVFADTANHSIFNGYYDASKDSDEYVAVAGVGDQAFVDRPGHMIARKGRVTVELGLDPIVRSMDVDPQAVVTVMRLFLARPPRV